jgi:hypothetical protein
MLMIPGKQKQTCELTLMKTEVFATGSVSLETAFHIYIYFSAQLCPTRNDVVLSPRTERLLPFKIQHSSIKATVVSSGGSK